MLCFTEGLFVLHTKDLMNEENNSGAGLKIIESKVDLEERRIVGGTL